MRMLCCLDGTNAPQVCRAARLLAGAEPPALALLTVIDIGPRRGLERTRERFWRPAPLREPLTGAMAAAETLAAEAILGAGRELLPEAEPLLRRGHPELEIVKAAAEWHADLILICPRAEFGAPLPPGPRSVGHVARFVLDHAPCPVALLRPRSDQP